MRIGERDSNVELLRIVTILGVIILHYNNANGSNGGVSYAEGINKLILYIIESLCVCAVDLFILITGYFMSNSPKRTLLKPLQLLVQVVLFSFGYYMLRVVLGRTELSFKHIVGSLVPANYFVILYIALYFISPFINLTVSKCSMQMLKRMLVILLLLFSVYPTLVDFTGELLGREWIGLSTVGMYGSQRGYTIVNFVLMYIIGAAMRRYEEAGRKDEPAWKFIALYALGAIILTGWAFVNDFTGYFIGRSAWEYCNPMVVFLAVLAFRIFRRIKLPYIKVINELAKGVFTVYLVHNIFLGRLHIEKYAKANCFVMLGHIIVSVTAIFLICWLLYKIYEHITKPIYRWIGSLFPVLTQDLLDINR